jgi:two-component system cell cycle sensor histidine kinase/response regulator CckA
MITDMIMPGMNGRELAERLMTVRPETRVLDTSGYTDHALGNVLAPDIAFIPKPFTSESLLSKVREILDPVARERHCRGASQDAVPSAAKRR